MVDGSNGNHEISQENIPSNTTTLKDAAQPSAIIVNPDEPNSRNELSRIAQLDTPDNQVESTKPVKRKSIMDANIFLDRLTSVDYRTLPSSVQTTIRDAVLSWAGLVTTSSENGEIDFGTLLKEAKAKMVKANDEANNELFGVSPSMETLQMRRKIAINPPLDFPIKGEYTPEELPIKFPKGIELQSHLGQDIKIKLFNDQPKRFYIVERPDGERQALRLIKTSRTMEQINEDLTHQPEGLPKLEAIQFQDGTIGILAEWIDGRHPNMKDPVDRDLCTSAADSLITVPHEEEFQNTIYDLNHTNFIIRKSEDGQEKAYYVDSDMPELIFKNGLSSEIPEHRKQLLQRGKETHFR